MKSIAFLLIICYNIFMSRPFEPLDRVYYSAHPGNTTGGDQTPEVEALLIPEVVDALSDAHEAGLGALKYDSTTAEKQLARIAVLKSHLDPSRATRLARGATLASGILERGIEKDRARASKNHTETKESDQETPFAEQVVRKIAQATERGQKISPDLEKKISDAYASDPSLLFEVFASFRGLEQEAAKSNLTRQALINMFANQPFPIRTTDPEKFIDFMGQTKINVQHASAEEVLGDLGEINSTDLDQTFVKRTTPTTLETAILCGQFIKYLSSASNPKQAIDIANGIYEQALEYGLKKGAENLLSLFVAIYSTPPESIEKTISDFGVALPKKLFTPQHYYTFGYMLLRSRLKEAAFGTFRFDAFSVAREINYGVAGRSGVDLVKVATVVEHSDKVYGTNFMEQLEVKHPLPTKDVLQRSYVQPVWSHKAQELRYEHHRGAAPDDMLLSPTDAFSIPTFSRQTSHTIDAYERTRNDYKTTDTEHVLSHRGYFNTIAKLLPLDIQPEQYPILRQAIENIKTDVFVNGEYFISPKGDRFIIDDPELVEAGLEHITFSKLPSDKRSTRVVLRFGNANISCVISPDMELFTDDGKPLTLQEGSTEPLEYLIFGHLQALKCRPEAVTETFTPQIPEIDTGNESFVRRAHMRKLPDGHQPSLRQIELAAAYEDFDLVEDNAYRERRGLQIRTYVEETIIDPKNLEPNNLKARAVTKKLKQLTNQPASV